MFGSNDVADGGARLDRRQRRSSEPTALWSSAVGVTGGDRDVIDGQGGKPRRPDGALPRDQRRSSCAVWVSDVPDLSGADACRPRGRRRAAARPRSVSSTVSPEQAPRPLTASPAVSAISTIAPKVCSRSCEVVSSPVTMWSLTVQIASALRPYDAASV